MPDIVVDGFVRVSFVAAIANINAPVAATELTGGLLLASVITPDGLIGFEPATADVDNSALNSTFDTKTIGRDSFSGTMLRLKKQSGTDTAWTTLVRGTTGYIVVRRYMDNATAYAAGQPVNVYPIICGQRRELAPTANSVSKWEVDTKINSSAAIYVLAA
jgi:hypothetical protein